MKQLYVKIVPDDEPDADGEWRVVAELELALAVDKEHDFDSKTKLLEGAFDIGTKPQRAGIGQPIRMIPRPYHVVAQSWGAPRR